MSASISTHTTRHNKVREELFNIVGLRIRIKRIIEYIDWMTSLTYSVVGGRGTTYDWTRANVWSQIWNGFRRDRATECLHMAVDQTACETTWPA